MFVVDYKWHVAHPPQLKYSHPIPGMTLFSLQQKIEQKEISQYVWLGICPTSGMVTFRAWDTFEEKWYSSRPGAFNTEDGTISIVRCDISSAIYHWTLAKLQEVIEVTGQDIKFFKVEWRGEISYIPYEVHHENEVRAKLERLHGYTILDDNAV